ncbi:hypothetical protein FRC09_004098 [Ceratobasidium sp. 395]|nr:hypothetical protein FRC09_004098 [Ceratobasidium sp. 395]
MNSFFKKAQEALQQVTESQGNGGNRESGGQGSTLRLPTPVLEWIDKYVDTFAPSISKQVSDEIVVFQDATLNSLEEHIKAVFQAVFRGDFSAFQTANNITEFRAAREDPRKVTQDASAIQNQQHEKLSDGLTIIRAHTREDFRDVLGKIEEALFNSLPSEISGPLIKVLGGNPFSDDDQQQQQRSGGGGGFNVFEEIKDKLKTIIERIQKGLRDRVLEVVSGGHRKLEDKAWGNVQDAVVTKVRQFVPGIQVKLDD